MFSAEVRNLLIQVISSWQVLMVTVVIVLYFFLVSYVARAYHRPRKLSLPKKKKKAEKEKSEEPVLDETDELGLEEQGPVRD